MHKKQSPAYPEIFTNKYKVLGVSKKITTGYKTVFILFQINFLKKFKEFIFPFSQIVTSTPRGPLSPKQEGPLKKITGVRIRKVRPHFINILPNHIVHTEYCICGCTLAVHGGKVCTRLVQTFPPCTANV